MIKKIYTGIMIGMMVLWASGTNMIMAAAIPAYDSIGAKFSTDGMTSPIYDGLIAVKKNSKWGFADTNGRLIIPCQYSEVKTFNKGYVMVCLDQKWGVIDKTGKFIIAPRFTRAMQMDISDGFLKVNAGDRIITFDFNGHEIDLKKEYPGYDQYQRLSETYIAVARGSSWGIIDNTGKELIPPQFPAAAPGISIKPPVLINNSGIFGFIQNTTVQVDKNGEFNADDIYRTDEAFSGGIVNKEGQVLLPFEFTVKMGRFNDRWFNLNFRNGRAPLQSLKDGKIYYVDQNGKILLVIERSRIVDQSSNGPLYDFHNFSEGMCRIESKGKWGFIDETGKIIVDPKYDFVFDYVNGYSKVRAKNQKFGSIDKNGKVIVPPIYDDVSNVKNDMIVVCNKGKYAVLNTSGKTILPMIYTAPPDYDPATGLFIVRKDSKYGFVNKYNKIVVPIKYDSVKQFTSQMARVKVGSLYGYINLSGKVAIPIKYKSLSGITANRIFAMDKNNAGYVLDLKGNVVFQGKTGVYIDNI